MKKTRFIFGMFLTLQSIGLLGQELGLELEFEPFYTFRNTDSYNKDINVGANREKGTISFGGNALIDASFDQVEVFAGVGFTRRGYLERNLADVNGEPLDDASMVILDYFNVPLGVRYKILQNVMFVDFRVSNYFLIAERYRLPERTLKIENSIARDYNPSLKLGVGLRMKLGSNGAVALIPNYEYFPRTIYDLDDKIQRKLYSVGVSLNVSYYIPNK